MEMMKVIRDYEMTYYRPTSEEPIEEVQPDNPNAAHFHQKLYPSEDNL